MSFTHQPEEGTPTSSTTNHPVAATSEAPTSAPSPANIPSANPHPNPSTVLPPTENDADIHKCAFETWRHEWTSGLDTLKADIGTWTAGRISARNTLLILNHKLQHVQCECHRIGQVVASFDVLMAFSDVMKRPMSVAFKESLVCALDEVNSLVQDVNVQH